MKGGPITPLLAVGAGLGLAGCSGSPRLVPPALPYQPAVQLGTNRFVIGEPVDLAVELLHARGTAVDIETFSRGDELVVRDLRRETRPVDDEMVHTRLVYRITSLVPGAQRLPEAAVRFDGAPDLPRASLPALDFVVESSLPAGETAMRPAKPPADWPGGLSRRLIGWVAAILAAAAVGGAALLGCRTRRARPPPPALPPHLVARRALDRLRQQSLAETGQFDRLYTTLSDILRRYLEGRFSLDAPEQTTEEFLRQAASSRALDGAQQERCRAFLEQSDLVKFARDRPSPGDAEAFFRAVESFIDATEPREPAA